MQIPILKIGHILITSLPVALTDREAMQLQDDILAEAARTDAKGLVIDITALDVVDSFMARVLSDTADMVELMGTRTVIVGMRPLVAVTLVQMGRRLVGVETALDLEKGLARLRQLLRGGGDETDTT
jgi:rsbT antagonist protein RsbS